MSSANRRHFFWRRLGTNKGKERSFKYHLLLYSPLFNGGIFHLGEEKSAEAR